MFWYSKRANDRRLWAVENYVDTARLLRQADPRIRFVLTGTRNERFLSRRFAKEVSDVVDLVGHTSVHDLAALMSSLRVFLTHDTGALHVACVTDVPLVALFGPSRPQQTGPYPLRPQHTVIKRDVIAEIRPSEVCAAILARLQSVAAEATCPSQSGAPAPPSGTDAAGADEGL
jgi:ADP-heptose:LPS heptosyltransferase